MALLGLGAVVGGRTYEIGTFTNMGPGFFPAAVGIILIVLGLAMVATAGPSISEKVTDFSFDGRSAGCIVGSLLAFIALSVYGGLILASFAVVFIAALADKQNKVSQAFWLAVVMTVISVAIFWWGLSVQLPLWSWG